VEKDGIFLGRAEGVGNPVLYVGARTGRDGIHGATMASAEFGLGSEEKRPTVQVGDPFMEKVLLEACLEALATGAVVGIQDMGAAGLSCSSSEMAARAGNGARIDVDRVPQRETGMSAYEVMLSESQERMLLVAAKGREAEVQRIFEKWDLHAETIGEVTADGRLRVTRGGRVEADVPVTALTDAAPIYDRPWVDQPPAAAAEDPLAVPIPDDLGGVLERLLAAPTIACKRWIWRQYDSTIRSNTLLGPGSDAAVVRIKGTRRALAMSLDGNGRHVYLDPLMGARLAVAEACRNVVAAGARPIGATNCLNFGNPEKPRIMGQLVRAIQGIGEACRAFGVPITGGNVSLYNETDGEAIYPTPTMGVVGLLEEASKLVPSGFRDDGDHVLLLGETHADIGGSEYLAVVHGKVCGPPPALDLDVERRLHEAVLACADARLLRSAHDPSDGGLAVALAECAMTADGPTRGGRFAIAGEDRTDVLLFSESPSRMVVSTRDPGAVERIAAEHGVACQRLGIVGGDRLSILVGGKTVVERGLDELHESWMRLERELGSP
jgi:phosphoribosylformylglycinamidine synthase